MLSLDHPIMRAVEKAGSQAALAQLIEKTPQLVSAWIHEKSQISAKDAIRVSTETGIPLHDLCPDVFPKGSRIVFD